MYVYIDYYLRLYFLMSVSRVCEAIVVFFRFIIDVCSLFSQTFPCCWLNCISVENVSCWAAAAAALILLWPVAKVVLFMPSSRVCVTSAATVLFEELGVFESYGYDSLYGCTCGMRFWVLFKFLNSRGELSDRV